MLQSVTVTNVLNHRRLRLDLGPATLIAGGNARGKTALLEAIRFGIAGHLPRGLTLKKDVALVVAEGTKSGGVQAEFVDPTTGEVYQWERVLDAKLPAPVNSVPESLLTEFAAVGLYAERFAHLDDSARRALLFAATGVKPDAKWVTERLLAEGVEESVIAQCVPLLKASHGFVAAAEAAVEKAKAERSAWRGVTSEVYGADKAKGWEKPVPEAPVGDLGALRAEVRNAEDRQRRVTALIELAQRRATLGTVPESKTIKARKAQLDADRAKQEDLRAERKALVMAMAAPAPATCGCPGCGLLLRIEGTTVVEASEPAGDPPDHREAIATIDAQLQDYATRLSDEATAIEKLAYIRAQADALALEEADDTPLDALQDESTTLAGQVAELNRRIAFLEQHERAVIAAKDTTTRAAQHHRAAVAWDQVATLFGPDGLPGELLAKAMGPFRAALQFRPEGCPAITVTDDMAVRIDGREYLACSESERWRADAVCAAALARIAKAPLLLLDRLDVLAVEHRADFLDWLVALGGKGLQVIAAGTLKSPPEWEGLTVHWLGSLTTDAKEAA